MTEYVPTKPVPVIAEAEKKLCQDTIDLLRVQIAATPHGYAAMEWQLKLLEAEFRLENYDGQALCQEQMNLKAALSVDDLRSVIQFRADTTRLNEGHLVAMNKLAAASERQADALFAIAEAIKAKG